jgi:hypothetical protein
MLLNQKTSHDKDYHAHSSCWNLRYLQQGHKKSKENQQIGNYQSFHNEFKPYWHLHDLHHLATCVT